MPIEKHLPPNEFNNVVRWIKTGSIDQLKHLKVVLAEGVERLGLRPRARHAVAGIPEGSDHIDSGSVRDWLAKVTPDDTEALAQITQLAATITARLGA